MEAFKKHSRVRRRAAARSRAAGDAAPKKDERPVEGYRMPSAGLGNTRGLVVSQHWRLPSEMMSTEGRRAERPVTTSCVLLSTSTVSSDPSLRCRATGKRAAAASPDGFRGPSPCGPIPRPPTGVSTRKVRLVARSVKLSLSAADAVCGRLAGARRHAASAPLGVVRPNARDLQRAGKAITEPALPDGRIVTPYRTVSWRYLRGRPAAFRARLQSPIPAVGAIGCVTFP